MKSSPELTGGYPMKEAHKLRDLSECYREFSEHGNAAQHDWRLKFADELTAKADQREQHTKDARAREYLPVFEGRIEAKGADVRRSC
jgi:hypothetical protein